MDKTENIIDVNLIPDDELNSLCRTILKSCKDYYAKKERLHTTEKDGPGNYTGSDN